MADVSRILITSPFRMVFPKLLQAEAYKGKKGSNQKPGDPKFTMEGLFQTADLQKFHQYDEATNAFKEVDVSRILVEMAKEAWGENFSVKEAVASKDLRWPIKTGAQIIKKRLEDGKKPEQLAHYEGATSVINFSASEEYPPTLRYPKDKAWVAIRRGLSEDEGKGKALFGLPAQGHYARAEVKIRTWVQNDIKYLTFYMNTVDYLKAGDPIKGGGSLMDKFSGVSGGESEHNPTADLDDDIPL